MMLDDIRKGLEKRSDLAGWTIRHITTRSTQLYAVPRGVESRRIVDGERYRIDVLRQTQAPDGSPAIGSGDATVLPGGDIGEAIEQAALVAGLVTNPVHGLPAPAPLPDVPLVDPAIENSASRVLEGVFEEMSAAAARHPEVQLTAGECYADLETVHLVNSRGIDASQALTEMAVEFVLFAQQGEREAETFTEMTRRRASDLNIGAEIEEQARHTRDLLEAGAPPNWQGPVVLRGRTLANYMTGDHLVGSVIQLLGSAAAKYGNMSRWEIGKPFFQGKITGDPLTLWATRTMPYGVGSNLFDDEGVPAQRLPLIHDNQVANFAASQRYAEYLGLPLTGDFGGVELAPGKASAADLLAEPYVEVVQFSWFNPDGLTGDFASEIRLGYLVENGIRKPFKGGLLIGNYLQALANVHWSAETGFFGTYLGPHTARFNDLKIAGD